MEALTRRQLDVLNHIAGVTGARGVSPNLREIATAFGVGIPSVQRYLRALRRKGYVDGKRYAHRGIRLTRGRREWNLQRGWLSDFDRRIGSRLRGETDLARVFGIVRDEIRAWLDVDRAELFVHDAQGRRLRDSAFYDHPDGLTDREVSPVPPDGVVDLAYRKRRTFSADGGGPPDLFQRERDRHPGLVSCAAIPVKGEAGVLGVLRLEERRSAVPLDEVKLARATMAAAALAPAIRQAGLNAEVGRRIRLQAAMVAICRVMSASGDFRAVVRNVHGIVQGLVDAPCFEIRAIDRGGRWWTLYLSDTAEGKTVSSDTPVLLGAAVNPGQIAIQTQPYYILHRTPVEIRALEEAGPGRSREGWTASGNTQIRSRSIMYAPLKSGEEMIGCLSVQSYRFNAYSLRDAEDLILVGEYIGLALRNAWRAREERARPPDPGRARQAMDRLLRLAETLKGRAREEALTIARDLERPETA